MSTASVSLLAEKVTTLKQRYAQLDELGSGPRPTSGLAPPAAVPATVPAASFQQQLQQNAFLPRGPEVRIGTGMPSGETLTTNLNTSTAACIVRPTVPPREVFLVQGPNTSGAQDHNGNHVHFEASASPGNDVHHLYAPRNETEVSALEQQQHLQSPPRQPQQRQQAEAVPSAIPVVSEQQQAAVLRPAQDAEVLRKLIADEVMRQHGFVVSNREGGTMSVGQGPSQVPGALPMSAATLQHHATSPIERPRGDFAQLGQPTPHHTADSLFYTPGHQLGAENRNGHHAATGADVLVVAGGDQHHGDGNEEEEEDLDAEDDEGREAEAAAPLVNGHGVVHPTNQMYAPQPVPHSVSTHHQDPAVGTVGPNHSALRAVQRAASAQGRRVASRQGATHHRPASRTRLNNNVQYHRPKHPPVPESASFAVAKQDYDLDALLAHPTATIGPKAQAALLERAHDAYGSIARGKQGKSELVRQYPNILAKPRSLTGYPQPASVDRLMERLSEHALALKRRDGFQETEGRVHHGGAAKTKAASGLVDDGEEQRQHAARRLGHTPRLSSKNGTRRTREDGLRPKKRGHTQEQIQTWDQGVTRR